MAHPICHGGEELLSSHRDTRTSCIVQLVLILDLGSNGANKSCSCAHFLKRLFQFESQIGGMESIHRKCFGQAPIVQHSRSMSKDFKQLRKVNNTHRRPLIKVIDETTEITLTCTQSLFSRVDLHPVSLFNVPFVRVKDI